VPEKQDKNSQVLLAIEVCKRSERRSEDVLAKEPKKNKLKSTYNIRIVIIIKLYCKTKTTLEYHKIKMYKRGIL
jgi:hypothetical protein